jgi:hypothetical protein
MLPNNKTKRQLLICWMKQIFMPCIICTNVEWKLERTKQNKRTDEVKDNNKLITKEYQPLEALFHMTEAQP